MSRGNKATNSPSTMVLHILHINKKQMCCRKTTRVHIAAFAISMDLRALL